MEKSFDDLRREAMTAEMCYRAIWGDSQYAPDLEEDAMTVDEFISRYKKISE